MASTLLPELIAMVANQMNIGRSSLLLVVVGLAIVVDSSQAFEIPQSMNELKSLEELFKGIPEGPTELHLLYQKYQQQSVAGSYGGSNQTNEITAQQRQGIFLRQYLDIGDVKPDKCSAEHASELLVLLKAHQTGLESDKTSRALKFVRQQVRKQFELCKPTWDFYFSQAIEQLEPNAYVVQQALLESLLRLIEKNPDKRFKRENLRAAVKEIPAYGILKFMYDGGKLPTLDKNLRDYKMQLDQFRQIYHQEVYSHCYYICYHLTPYSDVYQYAFSHLIRDPNSETGFFEQTSDRLIEWLANRAIACKIKKSYESHDPINGKPDPIMTGIYKAIAADTSLSYYDYYSSTMMFDSYGYGHHDDYYLDDNDDNDMF